MAKKRSIRQNQAKNRLARAAKQCKGKKKRAYYACLRKKLKGRHSRGRGYSPFGKS